MKSTVFLNEASILSDLGGEQGIVAFFFNSGDDVLNILNLFDFLIELLLGLLDI